MAERDATAPPSADRDGPATGAAPDSGLEPDLEPDLDEFVLARIAEDKRIASRAARGSGREQWRGDDVPALGPTGATTAEHPAAEHVAAEHVAAEHVARHDPARVLADCSARRRIVLACRDARPDMSFLGARPRGLSDFLLTPADQHQLAALTLALLALPYAEHHDYRPEWRP